jgi:hypothetical protein
MSGLLDGSFQLRIFYQRNHHRYWSYLRGHGLSFGHLLEPLYDFVVRKHLQPLVLVFEGGAAAGPRIAVCMSVLAGHTHEETVHPRTGTSMLAALGSLVHCACCWLELAGTHPSLVSALHRT